MDTNKMREQFEVAFAQATALQGEKNGASERMKEFMRDELLQAIQEARVGDSYSQAGVAAAWWAWQASRAATGWQPMDSCPKHVEVLFYREDCGVISGQLTCADTFMTDKDRESGDYSEEEQYSEDAWCYGPDGVERLDGDLVPTHWMPYPTEPEVTP